MITLYTKFDKRVLQELPKEQFEGRVIVVLTVGEAERAASYLMKYPRLGIDTETRPNFKPGGMNPVALLQVSTPETCFLFRLNRIGLPECLIRLLTSTTVEKVGLSLKDDWSQLRKRVDFRPSNYVELQDCVKLLGVQDMSLQKLYANFFGRKISKTQRLSNWEADVLSEAQKRYAATDAWCCLRLYDQITKLRKSGAYRLVAVPEITATP
jgi:ribonuclease D